MLSPIKTTLVIIALILSGNFILSFNFAEKPHYPSLVFNKQLATSSAISYQ